MVAINRDNLPEALEPKHVQDILCIGRSQTYELFKNPPFHVIKIGRIYKVSKVTFFKWLDGEEQGD
ncbi:helix-turn-helix domain-containing protein [Peribacillus frigoritolerans]|uniref:DNA-binding protein n=1 Tax=Bacillaceae TaxID=186817 RepID=UPI000ACE4B87|nr:MULTISPECIES: DNA-binding protein [Bacillaceae]